MVPTHAFFAAVQALTSPEDGLTFSEVVANVPHDPVSIFTYLLLIVTYGGIFWIGRHRRPGGTAGAA